MTRLATAEDFRAFYGMEPPAIWLGLTDGAAFGSVMWDDAGRAWGFVDRKGSVGAVRLHRAARRMLTALRAAGERELRVFCDPTPGAEKWLRRLGFAPTEAVDGREVWLCRV